MKKSSFIKVSLQIITFVVWTFIFIGMLYIPRTFNFFSEKSINIATWTDLIDPRLLEKFYKETGIKVYLSYFEDNYELVQKVRSTKGDEYDLIIPSDFAIQKLIEYDLLKPLDKSQFAHWSKITSGLLSTYADPSNTFSLPYHWAIYGLGVDCEFFSHLPYPSWELVFKKPNPRYKVAIIGSPRETILMAAQYLFGSIENLSAAHLRHVATLLLQQKEWVEAYTEFRADTLLLSKACPAVVITTPHILRLLKISDQICFFMPQEGSFQVVDSWVIPKGSTKEKYIYTFLNFLYQDAIIAHHFNKYTFFPATTDLQPLLEQTKAGKQLWAIHNDTPHIDFFRNVVNEEQLNKVWIELKAL